MTFFLKPFLIGSIFLGSLAFNALIAIPYDHSEINTTDRMNTGGDAPYHPGLSGNQRGSYPIDDWSGPSNFYYSNYGLRDANRLYDNHGYGDPHYGRPIYQGPYGIGYTEYPDATYMRRNHPGYEAGRPY